MAGSGGRTPLVSTSTRRPSALSARTSRTRSGCSSGSPPVMTTLRMCWASPPVTVSSRTGHGIAVPPSAGQEYLVSHHWQPTVHPCRRTNVDGVPRLGPSPCRDRNTSATRTVASGSTPLSSATIAPMSDQANETLQRARGLAPQIAAAADEIERQRRLPDALMTALHEAGLFRMLLPRSLGGAELDPPT